MDSPRTKSYFSCRHKVLIYVVFLSLLAGVFLLGAEFAFRLKGVRPWVPREGKTHSVEPGGRLANPHPTLGYTYLPGRFTVTMANGYSYVVTHLPNSLRVTQPLDNYSGASDKPEIWIFGDSFTYGWSLNDEETYPWLLQQRLEDYQIVNFGVGGYGTIHSLLQYREALGLKRPKLAILVYAGFHDERNTLARMWQKAITYNKSKPLKMPYASLADDGGLQIHLGTDFVYSEFPMMRQLALIHFLEGNWNKVETKLLHSHQVSEALIMEMAKLSEEHQVKFLVGAITQDDRQMLKFLTQRGIPSVDISVEFKTGRYLNLPHDRHPNAAANKLYADKLEPAVKAALLIETGSRASSLPK